MRFMLLVVALLLAATPALADKTCRGPVISPRFAAFYETNDILPQDLPLAAKLYRQSAESGSCEAQYKLGTFYAEGRGVEKDDVAAYYWFSIAAGLSGGRKITSRSYPQYFSAQADARKHLTAEKANAVDQKAQAWLDEYYGRNCEAVIYDGDDTIDVKGTAEGIKNGIPAAEKGDGFAQSILAINYWQLKNDKMAYFWRGIVLKSANCTGKCNNFHKMIQNMRLDALSDAEKAELDKEISAWQSKK